MSDSLATLPPEYVELVTTIAASAKTHQIDLADVERAFNAITPRRDDDEDGDDIVSTEGAPDIALFLEELAKMGVEVDDGISPETLEHAIDEVADALRGSAPEDLSSFAMYRREAGHHRILDRAEETEMTHRILFYRRTVAALSGSLTRLTKRADKVGAELARKNELLELISGDTDGATPDAVASIRAEVAALAAQLGDIKTELTRLEDEHARAAEGEREAKNAFLSFNLRLAMHLAKKKWDQTGRRADLMDLVQQGNLGMLDAIEKFDPTRGYKFSTFATWHINQKISEWTYEQVGTIRVPTHRWRDARKISRLRNEHQGEHGTTPTIEIIANQMGKSPRKVMDILNAERMGATDSLDRPASDDEGSATIGEMVADQSALSPEQAAIRDALRTVFSEQFETVLNPRERRVLQLRFGINDDQPHTLEWIGQRMKITRERVRQIEAKALHKLRSSEIVRQMVGLDPVDKAKPTFRPRPIHRSLPQVTAGATVRRTVSA